MDAGHLWRFGDCEFDERRRELRVAGKAVDIEAKPLDLLRELLAHAGEVVTKDELLDAVWPGLTVVDGSLATAISKLRKAIGDADVIVTLPRIGYRLAVPVRTMPAPDVAPPSELPLAPGELVPTRSQWRLARRLDPSGSSEVWLGEHVKTREPRVFKFAADDTQLKGLKREVTLSRLLHESLGERPDFVRVLEWNFDQAPYFVESEYAGPDLDAWAEIHGGLAAVPLATRLELFTTVAGAVSLAHGLGVLHKDIKPGNILISTRPSGGPQARVADFGSAALLSPARLQELGITNLGFTHTGGVSGALTGTMLYLAPEVIAGSSPTPASDVYALGVLLYQFAIGDFRQPLAHGWEANVADPLLREDIAAAAAGDPARRLVTADELAARVHSLDERRVERARIEQDQQRTARREKARVWQVWMAAAAVLVAALTGAGLYLRRPPAPAPGDGPALATRIAVLPFQNAAGDPSLEYLRVALADEVATLLSRTSGVAVTPFDAVHRLTRADVSAQQAGRELGVAIVVVGHYVADSQQLHVTLESMDVATGRLLWRDKIDAPFGNLLATQLQIGLRVKEGMAPALGLAASDWGRAPKNEEAYRLFLESIALTNDTSTNAKGIAMLERSLALDSEYAPAWIQLGRRYYVEGRYTTGDESLVQKGDAANRRAVALDPLYVPGRVGMLGTALERGQVVEAYRQAVALVRDRPDHSDAHFALSYVLRFAGLLDEAASECDAAFSRNAQTVTTGVRSCAYVFILRGEFARAMNYVQLDVGSDLAKAMTIDALVRQQRLDEALAVGLPNMPQWSFELLRACMARRPEAEIEALAQTVKPSADPELMFVTASHLSYCGQTDAAADYLRRAIEGGYCSYPAITTDPLFAPLRETAGFAALRDAGNRCQQAFLRDRE